MDMQSAMLVLFLGLSYLAVKRTHLFGAECPETGFAHESAVKQRSVRGRPLCLDTLESSQFSSRATVPRPPSAQMLTMAWLPLGIAASSFTA
jgi:hypothetical protein